MATDTFHGTILAIITHRQFVSFVREKGYGNSQKLVDLLERLDLQDRKINKIDDFGLKIKENIDYKNVDNIIKKQRINTVEYFSKWIK